jgi:hypothetical protein
MLAPAPPPPSDFSNGNINGGWGGGGSGAALGAAGGGVGPGAQHGPLLAGSEATPRAREPLAGPCVSSACLACSGSLRPPPPRIPNFLPPGPHLTLIDWSFVRAVRTDDSAVAPLTPSPLSLQDKTGGGAGGYP